MNRSRSLCTISTKVAVALLLTLAADFLLFRQPLGMSLFIFAALVAAAAIAFHSRAPHPRPLALKIVFAALALAPLAENVSPLSVTVATIGLTAFALSLSARLRSGPAECLKRIAGFLVAVPIRLPYDVARLRKVTGRRKVRRLGSLAAWTLAIALGAVFVALFGIANPVIGYWMSLIDLRVILDFLDIWRLAFWLGVAGIVWSFLRPRLPGWAPKWRIFTPRPAAEAHGSVDTPAGLHQSIFGTAAILRALVVFNIIFALQTVLDGAYLWGGVELPAGLTYAAYAHRGAYALIVTALLAAIFVLLALRPGSATSADRRVRGLVYLWSVQNFVLVISSILRLDLYVDAYSLTYWRVAAFIWMGLVAAGIILIMARIALEKSNEWLLGANMLTLSAVLYISCFVNFAAIIAQYNVSHSRAMDGGSELDWYYLRSLGPQAIPAIDTVLNHMGDAGAVARTSLVSRHYEADRFRELQQNWRAWSFRNLRLAAYLDRPSPLLSGAMPQPQ
ncbi:DUF4153 domain-containing protein [Aminobacter sp. LjRoot7]|uniref:DUF4153 domain-containing protein n=1 Tax=Aminobacter sp. LjRoot7 TaxID=3342335 RepID=UPI003ECF87C1